MHGCNGKMGKVICDLVNKDADAEIVAGIDIAGANAPFPVFTDIKDCNVEADAIIDFTTASAVPAVIDYAVEKNIPAVICTTGLSDETMDMLKKASEKVAMFKSANMSLGINLIATILKKYSDVLYQAGFDVEILDEYEVNYACPCSKERVKRALTSLPADEILQIANEEGKMQFFLQML